MKTKGDLPIQCIIRQFFLRATGALLKILILLKRHFAKKLQRNTSLSKYHRISTMSRYFVTHALLFLGKILFKRDVSVQCVH